MKTAPRAHDENERLAALTALDVLDTSPEESFDELTALVCRILDVPICLISLVDGERQWFKSRQGLEAKETSRDISFCGHAVYEKKTLVVNDTLNDERFFDNPLVLDGPQIRFYAGEPIIDEQGYALGTLCAIDRKPRTLSKEELSTLKLLANTVFSQLKLRKKSRDAFVEMDKTSELNRLFKLFLDRASFLVALVEVDSNGIWFRFRNEAMEEYFHGIQTKFLVPKFLAAKKAGKKLEFQLEKTEVEGSVALRMHFDFLETLPNGKDVYSFKAMKI